MSFQLNPYVCQWESCSALFATGDELVDHVLQGHIAIAKSVKRKDLPFGRPVGQAHGGEGE